MVVEHIKLSYRDFFPYRVYRQEQQDLIQHIEIDSRLRKNVLLIAPNGAGKTAIALSGLLSVAIERNLKIIYVSRTHTQSARVIKELQKINTISPLCDELKMRNYCSFYKNLEKKQGTSESPNNFYHSLFEKDFNKPMNGEDVYEYCKEKNYCPYYFSQNILKFERVVACTYHWILNPGICSYFLWLLNANLNQCIFVIDECHNIIDLATQANSHSLTLSFLTSLKSQISDLPEDVRQLFANLLHILIKHLRLKKKLVKNGDTEINPAEILQFRIFLNILGALARDLTEKLEISFKLRNFITFWNCLLDSSGKSFFCYNLSQNRRKISLEIVSIDPREGTLPIFLNNYACINLTGTVNPYVYTTLTGLNCKISGYKELIANSPFKSNNIKAFILEGVNTSSVFRTPEMYQKMIQKIEEVILSTPANIGIFCASYRVLNDLVINGISEKIKAYGKRLFIEKPYMTASANSFMLKNFKESSNSEGAVLLGVCGGRNSEGEDYPGDYMNSVIIAGFPYNPPNVRTKVKIAYYNKAFNNHGWLFAYLFPAMQRANQAAGRPIRREEDKGAIFFLDSRFKDKQSWISDWIRKEIKIIPDKKGLIYESLRTFWS